MVQCVDQKIGDDVLDRCDDEGVFFVGGQEMQYDYYVDKDEVYFYVVDFIDFKQGFFDLVDLVDVFGLVEEIIQCYQYQECVVEGCDGQMCFVDDGGVFLWLGGGKVYGFDWVKVGGDYYDQQWEQYLYFEDCDDDVSGQEVVLLDWCYLFEFVCVYDGIVEGQ